ncbi:MAG: class I SAM-dependent methyltransferase [Anaerolineae bacterium]|nr:class I SAM-dependent methyltransferase [Anaerolineae bacterium]MCO5187591.1 class I SAM-dependent methyltransferase [Anaerolineae bacterium]MCO5204970.1 class I SAM-dependent methyltransferase [Anaerolineae bacterium]
MPGRRELLERLPKWLSHRIEVNRIETLRMLDQARAEIPHGAHVLDAGSGEGRYKHYFDHTHYVGVDLAVGDDTWDYTGLDTVGNLRQLPFPDASFDAAVCIQTMEHVNQPFEVSAEIGRVLKPGGRYYLAAPMNWHQHQKPHDFFRYTSFGFQTLMEASGMRVVEMRPWGGYFWFLSFNLQMMEYWLFPKRKNRWLQLLQRPFQLAVHGFFFLIMPIPLYYLDRLDTQKDATLGWVCISEKTGPDNAESV